MAGKSIADLNVRLGFIFDDKALKQMERNLLRTGQKLSRIGSDLTTSLSAPLALLGGAAIKSAGDIESLTLALKSQLGSAEAAKTELEALTEAAKNPGLGVEQAVRGSVRLQGVGFSADEAREAIIQMGNAIAATGGSAQELDNVTRQFAQMTSKGRVLQEDISVIAESMPGLAQLMGKAFGTQNVEAIRDMGVSGKEFVKRITEAAKELPRVEGGIKNSIGNAIDSLKQSAAKLGFALNNAFDITGSVDKVAALLVTLADGFASLNPSIQTAIVSFGGLLVAMGPLTSLMGGVNTAAGQLVGVFGSLLGSLRAMPDKIAAVVKGFTALNAASRAFVVIGIAAAIVGVASAMGVFNKEATAAEKVQTSLNSLHSEAEKSIAAEKGAVGRLISVLNSETASREEKAKALNELKAISPEYFGQLKVENGLVTGLNTAYEGYIQNLLLAAKARKAEARLIEIDEARSAELEKQAALQKQLADLSAQQKVKRGGFSANETGAGVVSGDASKGGDIAAQLNASKALVDQLKLEEQALTNIAKAGFEARTKQGQITKAAVASTGELSKETNKYLEILRDIQVAVDHARLIGEDEDLAKLDALESALKKTLDLGFKPLSKEVQNLKTQYDELGASIAAGLKIENFAPLAPPTVPTSVSSDGTSTEVSGPQEVDVPKIEKVLTLAEQLAEVNGKFSEGLLGFNAAFEQTANLVASQGSLMQNVFMSVSDAIQNAAQSGETSFAKLAGAAVAAAAAVVRSFIKQGVAAAVAKALSGLPFPANLAAGGVAGAVAAALFTKAINSIGVPAFARGTKNAPGGLSLVGEEGPELVNLPKHSQVYTAIQTANMLRGSSFSGGDVTVTGELVARGSDLVAVINSQTSKNKRRFG